MSADQDIQRQQEYPVTGTWVLVVSPALIGCRRGIRKDVVTDFHYIYVLALTAQDQDELFCILLQTRDMEICSTHNISCIIS